jgi:DNA-binding CsgD family transcriptional regulator
VDALIGRAAELARVRQLLDDAAAGTSGALLLLGDAGIGKTALCEAAAASASERGMALLRARAVEAEVGVAFAGLAELLAPVADLAQRLVAPDAATLAQALGRAPAGGGEQAPFAAAVALLRLLEALSAESPAGALLVLDDVHWLDDATLDAVCFAVRRLHADGIAVLLAGRPEPDRGLRARGLPLLELEPLAAEEAERLLAEASDGELAAETRRRLLGAAQGNPLALVELARGLTPEQRRGAVALPEPLRPSSAVEQAFRAQLAALPPETLRALLLPAADEGLAYGRIAQALERLDASAGALAPAERAGVLVAENGRLRFRHPLLRAAVYHGAPFAERAAAHTALAETLGGDGPAPVGEEAVRRAWHLAAAATGPDDRAAEALAAAGEQERQRGAVADAGRALQRAAELTSDPREQVRLTLAAASEFATAGETERALALSTGALEAEALDERLRVELEFVRGVMTMRRGELDAGSEMLAVAAERAAACGNPDRACDLLMHRSLRHRIVGDYDAMRRDAQRAGELARTAAPAGFRSEQERIALAELLEIVVLANGGRLAEADAIVERHTELLVRIAPDHPFQEVVATPAHVSIWSEQWERAERILLRMVDGARRRSAVTAVICPLAVHSQLQLRRGRVAQAHADAGEALELALDTRQHSLVGFAAGMLAGAEAVRGEEEACRARAAQAIAVCDAIGGTAMGMWPRAALGHLELALGRPEEALGPLSACARAAERIGMRQPSVVQWGADFVEALVRAGREEEAAASLRILSDGSPTGWSEGSLARCRGLLDPGPGGDELLERSVAIFERTGAHVEAARSRLCLGERLRRGRQRRAAREPLQAALDVFEGAGARPWAQRARDELRATGQQTGRPRAVDRDELTPHEHRVALLVAAGRTNPEVAAELYVTRKTVEHHLSQIYRKLGLRSRTELARELAAELGPGTLAA